MLREIKILVIGFLSLLCLSVSAQERFFNLTAADVKIDSRLPHFSHSFALGNQYADSSYSVSILYPEFIDMTSADIARYRQLSDAPLPALPPIRKRLALDRKKGSLEVDFCPLVFRDGKYQILVRSPATQTIAATCRSTDKSRQHESLCGSLGIGVRQVGKNTCTRIGRVSVNG